MNEYNVRSLVLNGANKFCLSFIAVMNNLATATPPIKVKGKFFGKLSREPLKGNENVSFGGVAQIPFRP